jgi:hypothetical protein
MASRLAMGCSYSPLPGGIGIVDHRPVRRLARARAGCVLAAEPATTAATVAAPPSLQLPGQPQMHARLAGRGLLGAACRRRRAGSASGALPALVGVFLHR